MSQELIRLAIAASDDLARVLSLQELLEISLEQLDNPSEKTQRRIDLLLSIYLTEVEPYLEELQLGLKRIRQQLAAPATNSPQTVQLPSDE